MTDFRFKQFAVSQDAAAMKVGTDGVLLGAWTPVDGATHALDVGSGTGLIALMLAQRGVKRITGVEIDPAAAEEARRNVARSPWPDSISIINTDFRQFTPGVTYDLIVSNPPFFEEALNSPDPRRAAARSQSALPLDDLIEHGAHLLSPDGSMALILPYSQRERVIYTATVNHLYLTEEVAVAHHSSKAPKRLIALLSKKLNPTVKSSLYIQSPEYIHLTKDFYL